MTLKEELTRLGWRCPDEVERKKEFDAQVLIEGEPMRARWGRHDYPHVGKSFCWRLENGDLFGLYEIAAWRPLGH